MTSISYSQRLESMFRKCVRDVCTANGCTLKLDGFPGTRIALDLDCDDIKSKISGKRGDYAVVVDEAGDTFFLPIEFKSKNVDCGEIKKQLEASIAFFKEYLPNQCRCHPILVSIKPTPEDRRRLPKIKITGCKRIMHVRCNQPLSWHDIKKA